MVHLMILIFYKVFMKKLYLGSKSRSRQELLQNAGIAFELVGQDSDETVCDWNLPFKDIVAGIARSKMNHVVLPAAIAGSECFVLTADTMTCNPDGSINGKPVDREDAIAKIKAATDNVITGTAFCLERRLWCEGSWQVARRIEGYAQGACSYIVPDKWLETFLEQPFVYNSAGALFVEGFGAQFVKEVNGSYSAIIGLPMFEVREALEQIGFFDR
jgi:septum formation protein